MSADHLLDILLQAPWQGHVHDPPDPLGVYPHAKSHCSHHDLDLASTERQLDLLSVLQGLPCLSFGLLCMVMIIQRFPAHGELGICITSIVFLLCIADMKGTRCDQL